MTSRTLLLARARQFVRARATEQLTNHADAGRHYAALARLGLLLLVIAAATLLAWWLGLFEPQRATTLANTFRRGGPTFLDATVFVLVSAAATTVGLPGVAFTLAGGALFGVAVGSALNGIAILLGSLGGYWLARSLGEEGVRVLLGRRARRFERLAEEHSFLGILWLRLLPITPYNLLNFFAGAAALPVRAYLWATLLGIVPSTVIVTYFADTVIAGVDGAREVALLELVVASALLVVLALLPLLSRRR